MLFKEQTYVREPLPGNPYFARLTWVWRAQNKRGSFLKKRFDFEYEIKSYIRKLKKRKK
jgi:hypothetical protein